MKRIISFLLAVFLLIPIMSQMTVSAATNDEPTFAVSLEQANRGEKVNVTIRIENNPGVASIKLKAKFGSGLVLNSVTYNEALGGRSQQPETFTSPVTLNWFNGEANTLGDMTFATLNFTVAKKASVGKHTVGITYDEDDVYNIDEVNIPFKTKNGGVNVSIPVTGLSLDHTDAVVETGDKTYSLNPVFTPSNATNRNITWKSSDESVATVDGGVVTLLKKGESTITAISDDGGFEASCVLTVLCSHLDSEEIPAEASTCIKQGHAAYTVCKECGEIISGSDELLPFAEHKFIKSPRSKFRKSTATCISPAVYYKSCSVCSEKSTETFTYGEVNPDNHVGGTHIERSSAATCKQAGYIGDVVCDSCGEIITVGSVIAQLDHTPAASVRENEVSASCTKAGGYDEVVYCSVCGDELSRAHKTVPASGHTYGAPKWTWNGYSSATAVFSCLKGDDKQSIKAAITSEITKQPTLTEAGERTYRALVSFEGKDYTSFKTAVLPKLYLLGDADGNGEVDITDATFIQRYATGISVPFTMDILMQGDVDRDDDLAIVDATFIQRYATGISTPYPIGEIIG